jgi:hypothetical protein
MANRGLDPGAFSAAYAEVADEPLLCFNLGMMGLRARELVALADYLITRYQPRLLIYGTSVRDFRTEDKGSHPVVNNPWMQYHLGNFTLQGWLLEHSYAFRYLTLLATWKGSDTARELRASLSQLQTIGAWGYKATGGTDPAIDLTSPPDPQTESRFFDALDAFTTTATADFDGLRAFLALCRQAGVAVAVVEMPVHPTLVGFLSDPATFERFLAAVEEIAVENNTGFYPTTDQVALPSNGWYDRNHLNTQGAARLSTWLGMRLGQAAAEGSLVLP